MKNFGLLCFIVLWHDFQRREQTETLRGYGDHRATEDHLPGRADGGRRRRGKKENVRRFGRPDEPLSRSSCPHISQVGVRIVTHESEIEVSYL